MPGSPGGWSTKRRSTKAVGHRSPTRILPGPPVGPWCSDGVQRSHGLCRRPISLVLGPYPGDGGAGRSLGFVRPIGHMPDAATGTVQIDCAVNQRFQGYS